MHRYNPLNEMPTVLFLDLDETLLRTTGFENAADIFLGSQTLSVRKTAKYKEKKRRYHAALHDFDGGNTYELEEWARQRGIKLMSDYPYATRLRPGIVPFLEAVNEMFDEVNILTAGAREFQKEVIRLHGIGGYFDNIYGREDTAEAQLAGPLTTANAILVDDNGNLGSRGWNSKMIAMGALSLEDFYSDRDYQEQARYLEMVSEGHFLPIKGWYGKDSDSELQGVLDV